jgi:RNase P subunit RPR2
MSDTAFCANCGDYIAPENSKVRMDNEGKPVVLCEVCSGNRTLTPTEASRFNGFYGFSEDDFKGNRMPDMPQREFAHS